MKIKSQLVSIGLFAILAITFSACKKEEDPQPIVPTACFTVSATNVDTGVVVSMDAGCSAQGVLNTWNFGDSTTVTGGTVNHSWHYYGTKTVTLTVTSPDNTTASTTRTITVDPRWRFAGTYNVTQNCGSWVNPYTMTVSLSANGLQISNFNGISWDVYSTTPVFVNTNTIVVDTDALVDGNGKHWDVNGTATLNGNTLTFSYFVDNLAYYSAESVPYTQHSCNAVGTRQ